VHIAKIEMYFETEGVIANVLKLCN